VNQGLIKLLYCLVFYIRFLLPSKHNYPWNLDLGVNWNDFFDKTLSIKGYVSATFWNLCSYVLVLVNGTRLTSYEFDDGTSLTSYEFDQIVFYMLVTEKE
jgi:hypothetical protein